MDTDFASVLSLLQQAVLHVPERAGFTFLTATSLDDVDLVPISEVADIVKHHSHRPLVVAMTYADRLRAWVVDRDSLTSMSYHDGIWETDGTIPLPGWLLP